MTNHTEHSVGFVIRAARTAAYLVDGVVPRRQPSRAWWAATFWQSTGIPQCILTHLSCHSWRDGRLVAGWAQERRAAFARERPGLTLACDGLRVPL
jgi:hypothetical protein